jgi:Uri superfamily endonuclease
MSSGGGVTTGGPAARLYVALTWLPRREVIQVGGLGPIGFERGWYAYVGSAWRAREARVARHLRAAKALRWHADYLFARHPARRAWLIDLDGPVPPAGPAECALVEALLADTVTPASNPHVRRAYPGFGSSDCGCRGHLLVAPRPSALEPRLRRAALELGGRVARFPVSAARVAPPVRRRVPHAG